LDEVLSLSLFKDRGGEQLIIANSNTDLERKIMKTENITTKFIEIESLIQSLSEIDGNTPLKQVQPQLAQVKTLISELHSSQIKTTQDLRESETHWCSITKNLPDHIISLDREFKIQFINHPIPGLTVEQITGTPICNYYSEHDKAKIKALLETILATNEEMRYDTEYMTSNGEIIYYESRAIPRIIAGQTVGIIIVARDMNEHRNSKLALQQSKDQIELLFNSAAEGIYSINLKGQCTVCNASAVNILGYNRIEELLGQNMHNLIHHSHKDGSPYNLEKCKIYQASHHNEKIHCDNEVFWRADGTCFPVEYWSYPILQNNKIIGAVVTFIDSTERQQTALALRKSVSELAQLIDTANAPIFGIDTNGLINEWNQTAQRITGYTKEDVFGHKLVPDFILSEYQSQVETVLQNALHGEETSNYEFPLETKNGKQLMILLNATTRHDVNGNIIGVIGVGQDITECEQARTLLQKSERRLSILISNLPGAVYRCYNKTYFVEFVSEGVFSLTGYSPETFINGTVNYGDLIVPEDQTSTWDIIQEAILKRTPYQISYRINHANGEQRWIWDQGQGIYSNAGEFEALEGFALDVTKQKLAEEKLRLASAKTKQIAIELSQLIDTANAPIFGIDTQGLINEWNQTAQRITGYTKEDVFGHKLVPDFILPEYQSQVKTVLKNALHGEETSNYEFPLETKNGKQLMILLNATTRCDVNGNIIGVIGVGQDITKRKQAEQKLAKLNTKLEQLVDERTKELQNTNEKLQKISYTLDASRASFLNIVEKNAAGIMVVDKQSIIRYFNPAMQQLFNYTELEIESEFAIPTNSSKRIEVMTVLSTNEFGTAEMGVIDTIWENKPAYLLTLHDITELKKAEFALKNEHTLLAQRVEERTADLSQANIELANAARLKDKFLANMSHELRTPLNGILGMSDMLNEQFFGPLNEKQLTYVAEIGKSGRHLLSLISDLLDTAKIDAGTMELVLGQVAIYEIIITSINLLKSQFKSKNLQVNTIFDSTLPIMLLDTRKCKQIMLNLLFNAIKYTAKNGWIKVHAYQDSSMLKVVVSDNGIGIESNELNKIFSEFHQADKVRDQELGGTGIGLALTRRLVELHGGEIGVESEPNKGSSFWFTIPIKNQLQLTQDTQEEKSNVANYPSNHRILVAEDNEVNLMTVLDMLSVHDHQVAVAKNGQEAIDLAQTHKPELILMDIRMPVMNGIEATKRLRTMSQFKDTPIIALTASTGEGAEEQQIVAGCTAHLSKPIVTKELFAVLKEYLNQNFQD
jgi:PAS domain S-box-containing protein